MTTKPKTSSADIAVIFDMDGVLVDSVGLNWQAMNQALVPYGVRVKDDEIAWYLGRTLRDQVAQLNDDYSLALGYEEFKTTTNQIKSTLFAELRPKDGVEDLLGELRTAHTPLAVATSMPRELTIHRLSTAGMLEAFGVVVTAEDITAHKPEPEVYQRAAMLLGVDVSRCVVLEDAPAGIRAAKSAGMRCVAIRTPYTSEDMLQGADLIVPSMRAVSLGTIRALVAESI